MAQETRRRGTPYQKATTKIRVPIMIQDPLTSRFEGMRKIQHIDITDDEYFLDGPITRRVAVLDFDPDTGQLNPGVKFYHPPKRKTGYYLMPPPRAAKDYNKYDIYQPEFISLSVFGTVYRVLELIEKDDTLGRTLRWGFDTPQLLIIPRAGQYPNAFYDPVSHSLQFFFMPSPNDPNRQVYAALSRDIVAHETGHAVLDGIVPFLRHGISTESRALHETIADMTALLMALNSSYLTKTVLDHTQGDIRQSTAFSAIANEFAEVLGRAHALRDLYNDKKRGELGNRPTAYDLSEMLSGALYAVIMQMHEYEKPIRAKKKPYANKRDPIFSASGEALAAVGKSIKNMIFRALDYLPPGDVSFADFGRALLLANRQGTPVEKLGRDWLCSEFVKRDIVSSATDLTAIDAEIYFSALQDMDLEQLHGSDWVAYKFANEHRDFLGIPKDILFRVHPRLLTSYKHYRKSGRKLLFKVSWGMEEEHGFGPLLVFIGTTLVIDYETTQVVGLLTSDRTDAQRQARSDTISYLKESGLLQVGDSAFRPDGKLKGNIIQGEMIHGTLRVRNTVRLMHITEEGA